MKILLIGGTRFLGRYIAKDLAARDHEVVLANRGSMPQPDGAARSVVCDKNDREAFERLLTGERWDAVIDTILQDTDLEFVVDVLSGRVGHFIHTGSIGVYGCERSNPSTESTPLTECDEVYNFNPKLRQDQVLMRAHQEHAFPATVLRMSYIYGPGAVPLDGWGGRDPLFFQMMRDGESVPVSGEGRALLHPGYVGDLARAYGDALEQSQSIGQIYNIGGFGALEMGSYIEHIANAMEVECHIAHATIEEILRKYPDNTNERGLRFAHEHMCCSIAKAEREIGWRPRMPLPVGLRENVAWMKEHGVF